MRGLVALLVGLGLLVGCDGGDDVAGPSVPDIAGTWRGTWQDADVSTTLEQSGSSVTGTLQFGSAAVFDIAGTVDEAGIFSFTGSFTLEDPDNGIRICRSVNSAGSHLAISQMGNRMEGVVQHRSVTLPITSTCDEADGQVSVQQGTMTLDRAF